jgi:myo-inositol-1(or 4)-monophosphatase
MSSSAPFAELLDFIKASGQQLVQKVGELDDIGTKKRFLTTEDLRIERELLALTRRLFPGDGFLAEEEHDSMPTESSYWVCDPISGTRTFLAGLAHFGIALARVADGVPVFAAVYDPTMDELFEARAGAGARCNGRALRVTGGPGADGPRVLYNLTYEYQSPDEAERIWRGLARYDTYRNTNSFGVNYGHVAMGRYDGFVGLTKDAFPEVPGSLILREAGGEFVCLDGGDEVRASGKRFLGGAPWLVEELRRCMSELLDKT